jgi:deazaflavin-dependent oxidoreductase (nitroreductase family)
MTTTTTEPLPAQPSRPGIITRAIHASARVTIPLGRPFAGRRWFPLWGVVHHVGRSSGRRYATPVVVRATEDGFVVPLPWGRDTQWVRNVLAQEGAVIRWKGRDHHAVRPRVVDASEVPDGFSRIQRAAMGAFHIRWALRLDLAD